MPPLNVSPFPPGDDSDAEAPLTNPSPVPPDLDDEARVVMPPKPRRFAFEGLDAPPLSIPDAVADTKTPASNDDASDDDASDDDAPLAYRGTTSDPIFGYLIGLALGFGLLPLIPANADLRYVLVWGALALFGVTSWLFGTFPRIDREKPENVVWGIAFALLVASPLLLVGGSTLTTTTRLLFRVSVDGVGLIALPNGIVLALVVFVMPLGETLFFRGLLQQQRSFWLVGVLASVWSVLLFMPMLDIGRFPVVAILLGVALTMVNVIYSYVRQRNGLTAAWICQIVVNLVILFLPYLGG